LAQWVGRLVELVGHVGCAWAEVRWSAPPSILGRSSSGGGVMQLWVDVTLICPKGFERVLGWGLLGNGRVGGWGVPAVVPVAEGLDTGVLSRPSVWA
jgi:hypothetical protein